MIDKRGFLEGVACATALWYRRRAGAAPVTPGDEWLAFGGNQVGARAREALGAGITVAGGALEGALRRTGEALARATLVYEATFAWEGVVVRADALRRRGDAWDVLEVKAGKAPEDGRVASDQLDDLACTVAVAQGAGLPVARAILVLMSREYRLGDTAPLFVEIDVTDQVLARAEAFRALAAPLRAAALAEERPDPVPRRACGGCDHFGECLGRGIAHPIFLLPRLSEKGFAQLSPEFDLLRAPEGVTLSGPQTRIFRVIRSGTAEVDPVVLARLDAVRWPVRYLDFETVMPALPWFPGDGAYRNHIFQYSVHVADRPGELTAHHEYLAPLDGDWRAELAERLLDVLGDDEGSIIVYSSFEQTQLKALADLFPAHAGRIAAVIARLVDLEPIVREGYCHPGFRGRSSIKNVLPVVSPDLRYEGMAISEGGSASGVFGLMRAGRYDAETCARHREALLAYCRQDTLAMARVHQALERVRSA